MKPLISILICSLPSRLKAFNTIEAITEQAKGLPVEILYLGDNWLLHTGAKRNLLYQAAQGKYLFSFDDDDEPVEDYITTILEAAELDTDCICFDVYHQPTSKIAHFSRNFPGNQNLKDKYLRWPNHVMGIRSEIAKAHPFENVSMGEDTKWSLAIHPHLKTEIKINRILYRYYANIKTSEAVRRHLGK